MALAGSEGCGAGDTDAGLVASHVKTFEGDDAEVTSCREVGDAITQDEDYGATLHEAWRCMVERRGGTAVDRCYVVYDDLESGIVRGLECASVDRGCPPGGRRDRGRETFLGRVVDPDLVLERARGKNPRYAAVRADVFYREPEGEREQCGYLTVQVPPADDAVELAAERVEANGWAEPRYSFSYTAAE